MQVKEKYGEFGKVELFNISKGNGCRLMKDVPDGEIMHVTAAVIMVDETVDKGTGETKEKEILHLKTDNGVYTTESPTVRATFLGAVQFMETHELTFRLMREQSKQGRRYMDLELVEA